MYSVQRIFTRPNTEVAFYRPVAEFKTNMRVVYDETDKCVSRTVTRSTDGLKLIISTVWSSESDWNTYRADPVCVAHFAARNAHNTANGITAERVIAVL